MREPTDRENEVYNEYLERLAEVSLGFCKQHEDEIGAGEMIDLTTAGLMYFAMASSMASNASEADVHEAINEIWSDLVGKGLFK